MIKRLRLKFVILSTGLLLVVLTLIIGMINMLNYRAVTRDADAVLELLLENGGAFPSMNETGGKPLRPFFSPELPYESRYFTVYLDTAGIAAFSDTRKIAAVDAAMAVAYAQKAVGSAQERGFIENYRYASRSDDQGSLLVFLDCGRKLRDARTFLLTSCAISVAGFALVSVLLACLSGWVVKPFSENYEKQKRFITDAGHELKTPLTIIDADAAVLEMDLGANEWLEDIRRQTGRLAELTSALVYLSRMEEAGGRLQEIEFPLSDVISESAQSFQALAVGQNKRFALDIQPMISIRGDERAFRQLTSILLDNALKYSDEGGNVSLSLHSVGRSVQLTVRNTCQPIAPEKLRCLFDRFYRVDPSHSAESGGHGIGLSIAKAIVTACRGTIQASSPDGESLCITATFSC